MRDRPGVTARELAAASGVSGGTLYALLRRLTDSGELEKRDLPGGQTGYAVGGARSVTDTAQASRVAGADGAPEASQAEKGPATPVSDGSSGATTGA